LYAEIEFFGGKIELLDLLANRVFAQTPKKKPVSPLAISHFKKLPKELKKIRTIKSMMPDHAMSSARMP